ncbi:MAG: hypothetical protein JW940_04090 [Polyangiaceae bacterium]|nr:hypothetical protein [Polyangiaceae bacterium]
MTQVDRDARAVLAAARRALSPSQVQRHRARARLAAAVGVGIGAGLGTTVTASAGVGAKGVAAGSSAALAGTLGSAGGSAAVAGAGAAAAGATVKVAAAGTSLLVAKWVAGGFLVAVTGATAMVGSRHLNHTSPPMRSVPTVASHAPRALHLPTLAPAVRGGVAAMTETQSPASQTFAEPPAARPRTDALLPQRGITEELEAVREADATLRAGNPTGALELLARAQRRFGGGELAEEREALSILAECKLDPGSGASRARRFMATRPRSVHVETIVDACHLGEARAQGQRESRESAKPLAEPSGGRGRFDDIDAP